VSEIRNIKENIIIAVDQEGGRVQRFNKDFTNIPSMQKVTKFAYSNNDRNFLKDIGWLISSELIAADIDINFAPVLDIDEKTSSIIGDRAFANNVLDVVSVTSNFIDGMHEAGMKSTGKHFPGHGGIFADSHNELAEDNRNLEELLIKDIRPYIELSNKLDAVMCAHVLFSNIDQEIPSYSKFWLKNFLKGQIKYDGLIFSDDLSMLGSGNLTMSNKAIKSVEAGCDMILVCNNRIEAINAIETFEKMDIGLSMKIHQMRNTSNIDWDDLRKSDRREKIKDKLKTIRE
jgi:beta-N-acetylhexosaminidase